MTPQIDDYKDLIFKQANYCFKRLPVPKPIELEDLESEGALVFCKMLKRWDPKRAAFITPFYTALWRHFASILQRAYRSAHVFPLAPEELVEVPANYPSPQRAFPTDRITMEPDFVSSLSEQAGRFVHEMLDPSDACQDYLAEHPAHSPNAMRLRIFRFLRYPAEQRKEVIEELRTVFWAA